MRSVIQRVTRASVTVGGQIVGQIGRGLLVLVGVAEGDGPADIEYTASKIRDLRMFEDEQGRMNRSVGRGRRRRPRRLAVHAAGRRPARHGGRRSIRPPRPTPPDPPTRRCSRACARRASSIETGVFQAHMQVDLVNDGPVTILLDSRRVF